VIGIAVTCPGCGRTLPESTFHRDSHCARGRRPKCAECTNAPQRRRYRTDPQYRARKVAQVRARRNRMRARGPMATNFDFAEFITDLDGGRVNQQLGEELRHIAEEVERTGQVGELNVKFKIKREGNMCAVTIESKNKVPKDPMHGSLFYFGADGELHREDPRQLKLRELPQQRVRQPSIPDTDGGPSA